MGRIPLLVCHSWAHWRLKHPLISIEHMFAFSEDHNRPASRPPVPAGLREHIRPVVAAASRTLPVAESVASLCPHGVLRRGSVSVVSGARGSGSVSLALALATEASAQGYWCGVVGMADPGATAMSEVGMDLRRVLFAPEPARRWLEVTAELLDGVEVLIVRLQAAVSFSVARRLSARARERRAALIIATERRELWPLPIDLALHVRSSTWMGIGRGDGHLRARRLELEVNARGEHLRLVSVWVPAPSGEMLVVQGHGDA